MVVCFLGGRVFRFVGGLSVDNGVKQVEVVADIVLDRFVGRQKKIRFFGWISLRGSRNELTK